MSIWRMVALLALSGVLCAQTGKRPKVGLVLEGGAALGFAHVGVLEWLEENRIPVDAIAGTSMGGLMGGLYAAGYTPAEIRKIAKEANWGKLLGGETDFRDLAYRRKEDKLAYPNRLELGVKNGLVLPAGFNEGHQIGMLFSRLLIGYPELKSFDELPVPFRCVATDLVSGKMQVWSAGRLSEALRSTMSIPAVFSPVRKDGQVLVDGGLLDNLPVDVARTMGVDVVIAVHLSKGPVEAKDVKSLLDVTGRSIAVMIGAAEMRTIEKADVVLVADLRKYESGDYTKSEEIAGIGRQSAEAKARMLRMWALSETEYAAHRAAQRAKVRLELPEAKFVVVSGSDRKTDGAIDERLEQVIDKDKSLGALERELTQIVGFGRFASIGYNQTEFNGEKGYEVVLHRKPSGPVFVNPAVEINGVDTTNTRFSIGARATWLDFWGYRSEWRNDVSFGSRFGISSEVYKPVLGSRFFVAPRAYSESVPLDLYVGKRPVAEYRVRNEGAAVDVGASLSRFAELRLGYAFNWVNGKQRSGIPVLEAFSARRDAVSLKFNYEGQDEAVVARRGFRLNSRFEFYPDKGNGLTNYGLGEVRMTELVPMSKQTSLLLSASGGSTVGPLRTALLTFPLGGPQRLGAYGVNELLTREYMLATAGVLYEFKSQPSLFSSKLYFTAFGQAGRVRLYDRDLRMPANVTGVFLLKTLLGPVFVGGSVGDAGHRKWFFGLGRLF